MTAAPTRTASVPPAIQAPTAVRPMPTPLPPPTAPLSHPRAPTATTTPPPPPTQSASAALTLSARSPRTTTVTVWSTPSIPVEPAPIPRTSSAALDLLQLGRPGPTAICQQRLGRVLLALPWPARQGLSRIHRQSQHT